MELYRAEKLDLLTVLLASWVMNTAHFSKKYFPQILGQAVDSKVFMFSQNFWKRPLAHLAVADALDVYDNFWTYSSVPKFGKFWNIQPHIHFIFAIITVICPLFDSGLSTATIKT